MHYTENLRTDKTLKGIGNNHENCSLRFGHGLIDSPQTYREDNRYEKEKYRYPLFCASYAYRRRQGFNDP